MRIAEAQGLVGTRVEGWTSYRGSYVGTLVEVKATKPWRGVVRVEAISELPQGNRAALIGEGELLEVGGVNVKPFDKFEKWTWQDTLILLVHKEKAFLDQWERDLKSGRSRTGNLQIIGQRREAISRFEQQIKEAPCTPGA